jgi:uncharacterized DUF497 family protein
VFEWGENKYQNNLKKHRIDFADAATIWAGPVTERQDLRRDYGEARFIAYGVVGGQVLAVVYTWRGEARRIISARKAKNAERRAYYEGIAGRSDV